MLNVKFKVMKNSILVFTAVLLTGFIDHTSVYGQDQQADTRFSVGADFYSNYIWRGTRYGTGPAVQPSLEFGKGGLKIGVWGSIDFTGYAETNPYISYSFQNGINFGLTDYYLPGLSVFETSKTSGSHALEINGGYTTGGLNMSANIIINEAGGIGSAGGDLYFQMGYSFTKCQLFLGAGNGWYTSDGDFNICNVGFGTDRTIQISDKFSIPVSGQLILNPERERLYLVVGFSF
jgi:hypothetical protein